MRRNTMALVVSADVEAEVQLSNDHVFVLAETEGRTVGRATRDNVRRVFSGLRGG